MPVALGSSLGPYRVVAKLGEGGMGEVYRATDSRLGRDVAIKVLPEAWARDPERLARFEREAKVLASLNHPNIAAIYGVEESGPATALVMELVEGPTLAERAERGRVPLDEALAIARQIAEALEVAHGKGIVHRDLKPQNVKLTPDGTVKVLDFGLAKALDPATSAGSSTDLAKSPTLTLGATVQGVILGTAAYMAPEQARGLAVDKRADIWAFGVVLFEMLSGRRLFAGEMVSDVLANVLKQDLDFELLPESTPPSVLRLLRRCLARQPKERLRDIGDARLELDDAALAERPSAPPASPRAGLRRAVLVAGAMLAVLALGVIGGRELRPAPAAETPRMHLQLLPPHEFGFAVPDGPAALSPDGRRIAFVLRGDRPESIWFRAIGSSDAVPVPGSGDGYEPFWSPDGRSIGFCQESLMRYDVETGAPPFAIARVEDAHGATWGTQGVIVYAPAPAGALMRVAATGGAPAPATTLDAARGETAHTRPQFLPDGVHFLYHAASDRPGESAIVVGALDSADTTRVLPLDTPARYAPPGYLLYVRGTTLLAQRFDAGRLEVRGDPLPVTQGVEYIRQFRNPAFSASSNGLLAYHPPAAPAQPTWLDRAGRVGGQVGAIGDRNLDLSPDGTRLAVNADDPQTQKSDVWVIDLVRGVRTRLTSGAGDEFGPVWSVDGERIFFASREGDTTRLVAKRASGVGEEVEILRGTGLGEPIAAFPDGRHLLIETVSAERRGDLEVVDLARGGAREPFVATASHEESGRISPDGRYVAYVSGESGRDEVYVQPFPPTGSRWQISANGGTTPRWRGDGRELLYVEDRQLVAVPVRISPSFGVGTPQPLFRLAERDIVVTGDGQRILAVIPPRVAETTPIELLVGWDRALAGDGRAP